MKCLVDHDTALRSTFRRKPLLREQVVGGATYMSSFLEEPSVIRLACSGEDVSFIARGAHLQALRERDFGCSVRSGTSNCRGCMRRPTPAKWERSISSYSPSSSTTVVRPPQPSITCLRIKRLIRGEGYQGTGCSHCRPTSSRGECDYGSEICRVADGSVTRAECRIHRRWSTGSKVTDGQHNDTLADSLS